MRTKDMVSCNSFIEEFELADMSLDGRQFTWSWLDGLSMCRLDRFLLSTKWCSFWPNCIQFAIGSCLSDHFPILLCDEEINTTISYVEILVLIPKIPRVC